MSGLSAEGLERVAEIATSHVGPGRVPGLVALVASGDDVHVEALGSLSIGGPPVRRDSLFRIASATKPITGAVTMALAGEGLVSLDEPVDRLLPELASPRVRRRMDGPLGDTVAAQREITVRDLLTFTGGFSMHVGMFMEATPGRSWLRRPRRSLRRWVRRIRRPRRSRTSGSSGSGRCR